MSETKAKKNKYAWVIMIVCCFASICGVGLITNTFGVFIPSIIKDLKFATGEIFLMVTIASWSSVVFYSAGGKVFEKFNVRYVTSIAGVIMAACLVSFANATQLWQFYVTGFVLGGVATLASLNVVPILINRWFIKHKNLAVGISLMFTGIAAAFFNPFFASISASSGWRTGYMVAAGIAMIYPVLAIIFVRSKPSDMGLKPLGIEDSEEMKDIADQVEIKEYPGVPAKYAFKSLAFWMIMILVVTNSFSTGFNQHWVNFGVTSGFSLVTASTLATVAMLSAAVFKVIAGWVNDKFGVLKSSIIFTCFGIISMVLLLANTGKSFIMIQIACIFFGGAVSITTLQPPMAVREIFGMRSYASIYPVAFMAMSFGTGLTYGLHGFFVQIAGSYLGSFVFNLICYILGLLSIFIIMKITKSTKEKYWREVGQAL